MFKSVFAKYISAFMLIIVVSFCMILSIVISLVNNNSENIRSEFVKSAARSTGSYIELRFENSGNTDYTKFLEENAEDVLDIMKSVTENCNGLSLLLSDNDGKLTHYANPDGAKTMSSKRSLPDEALLSLRGDAEVELGEFIPEGMESFRISFAVPIISSTGEYYGAVIAGVSADSTLVLMEKMVQTIVFSLIWVLIATLIAVYFITEMVTGPLRDMSRAAKSFAVGKFDVYVPVRGNDEVAELAKAFNNMAKSLANFENTRNAFMANVAHDLRTPMTTISGFIDNILIGAIPKEEQSHYLEIIKNEVKRLSRLVSSLLDITRLQAGDRKFNMISFDVCELARLILISFEQKIDEKKLDVIFECEEDRLFICADRDAIYQVLYNICDNAIKFSRENGKFRVSIRRYEKKKILVSVYNEGVGISEEDLPLIFERFYKADKSRGVDKTGTGLGMYISKTIIDAHGERIWVESRQGEFCEFFFTLPVGSDHSSAKPLL